MAANKKPSKYTQLIESIFIQRYQKGMTEIPFSREDIKSVAEELKIKLPNNLGDVIYTYRFRSALPETITNTAPEDKSWVIRGTGRGTYKFELGSEPVIQPSSLLTETKIPEATPGVISKYALNDEQALLAKLRYNRLIDIFTGLTCYSLQNHLRTFVLGIGQVETDEIYIGIDRHGVHYIIPIQAKGGKDKLGIVQVEQDIAICKDKFPDLICRPVASQFLGNNLIALFELEETDGGIKVVTEKHYRLVAPDELSREELDAYKRRLAD